MLTQSIASDKMATALSLLTWIMQSLFFVTMQPLVDLDVTISNTRPQ